MAIYASLCDGEVLVESHGSIRFIEFTPRVVMGRPDETKGAGVGVYPA